MPEAQIFIGLLAAIAMLAELARVIRIPYPVLFVLAGLALGFVPGLPSPRLDPETFFFLVLPPLLYSDAILFSTEDLRTHVAEISLLAIGLVVATTVAVAVLAHTVAGLPWAAAFVLGAVTGPTDPVAATAVIHRVGVSQRIATILEGEALLNDVTALVAYKLAVGAAGAAAFSIGHAALEFIWMWVGGALVGVAVVAVWRWVSRWVKVPEVEITLSMLMPLAAYLPAEHLGASGVLATVTAGLLVSRRLHTVSPAARLQGHGFWEVLSFLLNSTLFLLVGLSFPDMLRRLDHVSSGNLLASAIAIAAAVMLLRLVWMFLMPRVIAVLEHRAHGRPPIGELIVLGWSGMRGGISLAAALSIPVQVDGQPFPGRDEIIFLTYMVLLATLVVPGLTLERLATALGVATGRDHAAADTRARRRILQAALDHIDELARNEALPDEILEALRAHFDGRLDVLLGSGRLPPPVGDGSAGAVDARRGAIAAQRAALAELEEAGELGVRTAREIERELDLDMIDVALSEAREGLRGADEA